MKENWTLLVTGVVATLLRTSQGIFSIKGIILDESPISTPWADKVNRSNPWPEYPRPQLTRSKWKSLNGEWQYKIQISPLHPTSYDGSILVPFCVESSLSGVMMNLTSQDYLWYRRTFTVPKEWQGETILLHFGAVDYSAVVIVNGVEVGSHVGGYDAFTVDVTSALAGGEEELLVRVKDPTEDEPIPLGKQFRPGGQLIFYTATSGIWQTVWLEPVPAAAHVHKLVTTPDLDQGVLNLTVVVASSKTRMEASSRTELRARVSVISDGDIVTQADVEVNKVVAVEVPSARPWSPQDPFLYDLRVDLVNSTGNQLDEVKAYFGMRKVEMKKVGEFQRIFLNNRELFFQMGPLDQGFWPDGIYTAPTDEALRWDLDVTKALGFNMVRKHVKVEPARWYYWADRIGLLVWQDFPSVRETFLMPLLPDAQDHFRSQATEWVSELWNHPSIILWVVFNEAWGQWGTRVLTEEVMEMDPNRLVTDASGWVDLGAGHVMDHHVYPGPPDHIPIAPDPSRATVIGEFWGRRRMVKGHNWFGDLGTEGETEQELNLHYSQAVAQLVALHDSHGYNAAVFTQTTDVEGELNGIYTYDRRVAKMDTEAMAKINHIFNQP